MLVTLFCAVAPLFSQSLVIAHVSDNGIATPHGVGGVDYGFKISDYENGMKKVTAMVESWNPAVIFTGGDLSNPRGNRSQVYRGLLFRAANEITAPKSPVASTVRQIVIPNGTPQAVAVSAQTPPGTYVIGYGTANAEVITVTARTTSQPYTITAIFLRPHAIGEAIQTNLQTVTVQAGAAGCDGFRCQNDLYLYAVEDKFSMGDATWALRRVAVQGGLATIEVINPNRGYKVNDQVVIANSGAPDLDGAYSVLAAPDTRTQFALNSITVKAPAAVPDGVYTAAAMTATFKRIVGPGTYLGIQEDAFDAFEAVKVASVQSSSQFTATFAKSHPSGSLVRGSAHTPYLNWIRAGRFHPTLGNHDSGGGATDWCATYPRCTGTIEASLEYWGSPAGGNWTSFAQGKPWHSKSYGGLVTVYSLFTVTEVPAGSQQAVEMTDAIDACATPWCIVAYHYGRWLDSRFSRTSPNSPATDYWIINNPKIDAAFVGHNHWYEHTRFLMGKTNDPSRKTDVFSAATGGDALNGPDLDGSCAASGQCELVWANGKSVNPNSTYGAAKVTITPVSMLVEFYEVSNWATPIYSYQLTKEPSARPRRRPR
jgi:hypothetical protein